MILSTTHIIAINAMNQDDELIVETDNYDKTQFKIAKVTDSEYRVVLQTAGRFCLRSEYAISTEQVFEYLRTWS